MSDTAPLSLPEFSDHIVFVDESGDHGLENVSPDYPVFVLLFAIFRKDDYTATVCPELQRLKFRFWGHDEVILHEHELRKPVGDFTILMQKPVREAFYRALNDLMDSLPVTVIAVIIDKQQFVTRYDHPVSPYDYALVAGLERVFRHLDDMGQGSAITSIIVESRGRKEDGELAIAFQKAAQGSNALNRQLPFRLHLIPKASNSAGLQFADLMARPVGLRHLRPGQPNRAWDIIASKLRRSPTGDFHGWGLKVLP